ncbi:hypothetical protein B0T17DRAFT_335741 [Bombardia bombarda]|uniref:Telomerase reverse transcriptase n=1 Tax=Bombardia bombarda TaxID=252184 RepID=A0AA39WN82_9PEZI|nr:hypothetical protein B0T17DRAFT_335741 [Bombardia bombarda]
MSASRPAKRRRVGDGGEPCRTAADATRGTMPDAHPKKRTKKERAQAEHAQRPDTDVVRQAVLAQYYGQIRTLREHVLAELPEESIIRRKKISLVGFGPSAPERPHTEDELAVGRLLDTTLVAVRHVLGEDDAKPEPDLRWEQWVGFSQKGDESNVTLPDGMKGSVFSQSEIIDFVIWLLFSREKAGKWPKHLICDGFRRHTGSRMPQGLTPAAALIPGLFSVYPNHCVQQLKESPWPQLLNLLGMAGERIMIDLLIDCSIFGAVEAGIGNLHQLSGIPISDLEQLASSVDKPKPSPTNVGGNVTELRPSDITFVRSRMLYAKAALNSRGLVHFGLRHIHVLNRFPRKVPSKIKEVVQPRGGQEPSVNRDDESCIHIMMYMFPRQFGLHNVFTSVVDRQQTAQKFQDYTLREEEIAKKFPKTATEGQPTKHVPKRLRGNLKLLVQRLQVLHQRCSYVEMLQHYCPIVPQAIQESKTEPTSDKSLTLSTKPCSQSAARSQKNPHPSTQPVPVMKTDSIIELATPIANISAFCQGVLSKLIPNEFWGSDSTQDRNKACFLKHVDKFIHLRRFESMCLHELMQGMKVRNIVPTCDCPFLSTLSDTRNRVAGSSRAGHQQVLSV